MSTEGLGWRLRRIELYEAAVITRGQQTAELEAEEALERAGQPTPSRLLEVSLITIRRGIKLLRSLPDLPNDTRVQSNRAVELLSFVADFAGEKIEDVVDLSVKVEGLDSVSQHPLVRRWTPAEILEVVARIASRTGKHPEGLRLAALMHLMTLSELSESEAGRVFAVRDLYRRLRLLPDAPELEKVVRYEAHLARQLTVTLHEYEALQARGRGERLPLARLDVQGLE